MQYETVVLRQQFKNIERRKRFTLKSRSYYIVNNINNDNHEFKNNALSVLFPILTIAVHTNMEFKLHVVCLAMSSTSLVNGRRFAIRRCWQHATEKKLASAAINL